MRVGPGGEFAAIAGDVEMIEVDEAELGGVGDEAGEEEGLEDALVGRESREVAEAFQEGGQGGEG